MTLYAGIDVHKKKCYGVLMDDDGEVLKEGDFKNTINGAELFFGGFEKVTAVIEAGYSWRPAYERLKEVGLKVKLAHPYKVRAIAGAKIKTDSIDAKTLAHLLRVDLIPESYIPPKEIRKLRDMVRMRTNLLRDRTRLKARVRAELE